ncbi:transketolase [Legionella sp. W05-934-2]|uniref:transketolase n=1 Tax=Legionella sp. W05-934-2 TaxID=1198649 RepID=UPI0034621A7B
MPSHQQLANAIRFLSIDAVEKAQSGHPGMPLGMADIATVLWHKFIKHSPENPHWYDRDRFVLSNGHGSMLLYALLHLTGYRVSIDDLKQFRQLGSKTPGHPEYEECPGVETTTGPLGQGLGNAVGMAIAERKMAAEFNRPGYELVNHYTYAFTGDGCLMEGISHEVCSLAGTLKLGKLIVFYDDNNISIDGPVDTWFTDDTAQRFHSYHWQVIGPIDGHDPAAIEQAILQARADQQRPSLIICKTTIGYGSPVAGSEKSHGAPLGAEGVQAVRDKLHWPYPAFEIPNEIAQSWNQKEQGSVIENAWLQRLHDYEKAYPAFYAEFLRRSNGDLPDDWSEFSQSLLDKTLASQTDKATRKASQDCLNVLVPKLPELLGGSADLTGSNNTDSKKCIAINSGEDEGNYLYYGVREFGMAAIMNGLALHGGIIPYGGTFLVFSDYARNAMRLAALMRQRVIYVLTHDSIGLGEDGPTHQPVEHASMLRMTPNFHVWRPADTVETTVAWLQAISRHQGPSGLLLSRQTLPTLEINKETSQQIHRGGYILKDCDKEPELIIIATGSEVQLALEAAKAHPKHAIRVVSMPCCEQFLAQDLSYQQSVLPNSVRKRVAIEAGASAWWYQFVGLDGKVIGLDRFGVSAKAKDAYNYLGFSQSTINEQVSSLLKQTD